MATRQYDFTGSIIDTSSLPTVEDAASDNEVPNFGQCARRDSWFDSQTGVAGIRAIAADLRADRQLVYNSADNSLWEFVAGNGGVDDGIDILEPDDSPSAPDGRWLRRISGTGGAASGSASLVYELDGIVASIVSGETSIAQNDAVSLVCFQNDEILIMKADASNAQFTNSFIGFASSSASGVQGQYTLTADAAFVTGNVISLFVNGKSITQSFTSSSDETLEALAAQIAALPFCDPATDSVQVGGDKLGNDDRVINVLSGNGRTGGSAGVGAIPVSITGISVTGGASQPNFVFATSVAASGDSVDIHRWGHLDNFSGLTPCATYYLSNTAGAVATAAGTNEKLVGYATSATSMLVEFDFGGTGDVSLPSYYLSHGGTAGFTAANATATLQVYDFTSWSSGPSAATATFKCGSGQHQFLDIKLVVVDGVNTSGSIQALHAEFQGTSWGTKSSPAESRQSCGFSELGGFFYRYKGSTTNTSTGVSLKLERFNDTSWSNDTADTVGVAAYVNGSFTVGGVLSTVNGWSVTPSAFKEHITFNGTTWASATASTASQPAYASGNVDTNGWIAWGTTPSNSEIYNGTSWSTYTTAVNINSSGAGNDGQVGAGTGFDGGDAFVAGGNAGAGSSRTNAQTLNGTSWSSITNLTTGKCGPNGAVF